MDDIELGEKKSEEDLKDKLEEELKDKLEEALEEELKDSESGEIQISDTFSNNIFTSLKEKVYDELIEPAYYDDIKDHLKWRYTWRKIANFTEGLSQIIHASGAIFSFAAGFYNMPLLAFM